MSETYAVTVDVRGEPVRVGSATKTASGFSITFLPMAIQTGEVVAAAPRGSSASSGGGDYSGDGPTVFPPYGRSKGQPIRGATSNDLDFYANGARRSLGDPSKARWHDKEKQLLAAIEAEVKRQGGGGDSSGGGSDDGIPPPTDDDAPF